MSSSEEYTERRNSPRFPLRAYASVKTPDNEWNAHLLDISATGARLAILDEHTLDIGDSLVLMLELEDLNNLQPGKSLALTAKVVHLREHIVGILLIDLQTEQDQSLKLLLSEFAQS
jgi:hypothetical protein